jgi:predicted transcriptional regulator
MKYRSRSDIIALVLQTANNGATKTRIMYGAFLSYSQVKEYIQFLQMKGLLMHDEEKKLYRLTAKGLQFLSTFEELNEMMSLTGPNVIGQTSTVG